ncbi:GNAT family N-acetyltransferase [Paenibacillus hodogayensis]|uniref:GNAT family N-acetyltransferase n=1 Tax=Paenibacillus hodogayensis TaxID=279208 RepID=A0ABV5W3J2_9BACL
MKIIQDDLTGTDVLTLLREHLEDMARHSPPESVHALNPEGLRAPGVTFYSAWDEGRLVGCGAIKQLDDGHGEVKSMRTASGHTRKGVARRVLAFLIAEARERGYRRLSLETGSMVAHEPARKLYESCGFVYCEPFSDYTEDPYSVFMTLDLEAGGK